MGDIAHEPMPNENSGPSIRIAIGTDALEANAFLWKGLTV